MRACAMTSMTRERRRVPAVLLALAAVLAALSMGADPAAATPSPEGGIRVEGPVAEGVVLRERFDPGPVSSVEVKVHPGAPVRFVPVLSGQRVDGGLEVVSSMCDRVDGHVCVNANFAVCPSCGQPLGGIVRDGEVVQTPAAGQYQVSVVDGRFSLEPWAWSVGLWALGASRHASVEAHGVNVAPIHDGIVAYTPAFGPRTAAGPGMYELVLRAPKGLRTGVGQRHQVEMLRVHTGGQAPIPWDGIVLSGHGRGADDLWAFVQAHRSSLVELVSNTTPGLTQSFSGHPVLLRDGQRQWMDPLDGKVVQRHPRTVIGWDDQGHVWFLLVDGRQRGSRGMTLAEATDRMLSLGATNAVNLDGGGSSTMVSTCPSPSGWCLRNHPSDGRQRNVWVALAIAPAPAPPASKMPTSPSDPPTSTTPTPVVAAPEPADRVPVPAAGEGDHGTGEPDRVPPPHRVTGQRAGAAGLATPAVLEPLDRSGPGPFRDQLWVVAGALGLVGLELGLLTHLTRRRRRRTEVQR